MSYKKFVQPDFDQFGKVVTKTEGGVVHVDLETMLADDDDAYSALYDDAGRAKVCPVPLGIPLTGDENEELPSDWQGARITSSTRDRTEIEGWDLWVVEFVSRHGELDMRVYFDPEEVSGKEADRVAAGIVEALNVRRLG